MGRFHWNICIFKVFKGVVQFCSPPLVQIGSFGTLVQIGLKRLASSIVEPNSTVGRALALVAIGWEFKYSFGSLRLDLKK